MKNITSFLFILWVVLFFLFFSACKNSSSSRSVDVAMYLDSLQSITLHLDSSAFFSSAYLEYDLSENKLYFLNEQSNLIRVYNVSTGKQIETIQYAFTGPDGVGEVWGFHYHSQDSIFVFGKFKFTIYLTDSRGKVLNKYVLTGEDTPGYFPTPVVHGLQQLFFIDNKLYFTGNYARQRKEGKYILPLFQYDISSKKLSHIGIAPQKVHEGFWESIDKVFLDRMGANKLIISNYISDSIFVYDIHSGKTDKHLAKSKYFSEQDIKPFSSSAENRAKDYLERAKYHLGTPKYHAALYDPVNKLIYRYVLYQHDYKKFLSGEPVKAGIMVFDEAFNKLGEFFLPSGYDFTMSFVGPKGLYMANKKAYQANDNYLRFDLFTFKPQENALH